MAAIPIYLDYAATTPVAPEVIAAMVPMFSEMFGNPASKDHHFGREARDAVEHARNQVADIVHADPSGVVFTSGGTESNNLAINGIVNQGDHLVVSAIEHASIIDTAKRLEHRGVRVTYVSPDSKGRVHPESIARVIDKNTALVSVMLANNEIGTINSIKLIADVCHEQDVLLHCDAAQAVGKIPVDANDVDLLTLTGHKIYAPKGVGALIVNRGVQLSPQIVGGSEERNRRGGTLNAPSIVGLGKACELCAQGSHDHVEQLRNQLERLIMSELSGVNINGCLEHRLPNISSIRFDGLGPDFVPSAISKVACSAGSACGSGSDTHSHVLEAIGLTTGEAASTLRLSLGRQTTTEEIEMAASAIIDTIHITRA